MPLASHTPLHKNPTGYWLCIQKRYPNAWGCTLKSKFLPDPHLLLDCSNYSSFSCSVFKGKTSELIQIYPLVYGVAALSSHHLGILPCLPCLRWKMLQTQRDSVWLASCMEPQSPSMLELVLIAGQFTPTHPYLPGRQRRAGMTGVLQRTPLNCARIKWA